MLPLDFTLEPSWRHHLDAEWQKPYFQKLQTFIANERSGSIPIYPPQELIFHALEATPFEKVRVIIVGQDPYHQPGQAHGLSFSVSKGTIIPPSLKNIFKELHRDLGVAIPTHGCLEKWAQQGVLLLNTVLTVRQGAPLSHKGKGWEEFTDAILLSLLKTDRPLIFLLWGDAAKLKYDRLQLRAEVAPFRRNKVALMAPHPSPLSAHRGFLGSGHFSQTNRLLLEWGLPPIDW